MTGRGAPRRGLRPPSRAPALHALVLLSCLALAWAQSSDISIPGTTVAFTFQEQGEFTAAKLTASRDLQRTMAGALATLMNVAADRCLVLQIVPALDSVVVNFRITPKPDSDAAALPSLDAARNLEKQKQSGQLSHLSIPGIGEVRIVYFSIVLDNPAKSAEEKSAASSGGSGSSPVVVIVATMLVTLVIAAVLVGVVLERKRRTRARMLHPEVNLHDLPQEIAPATTGKGLVFKDWA
eukprot:tig00000057_g60.t1